MNTKVKVGLALAAVGAVGAVWYFRRGKAPDPTGSASLSEYSIVDCKCWRTDRFPDGRTVSTRVGRIWCERDGLGSQFVDTNGHACPGGLLDRFVAFPPEERIDVA